MLSNWRKQLGASDRVALAPKRRGPKPDPSARQVLQLKRDNVRLRRKLERAELIIDAQKKLCVALGTTHGGRSDRGGVMRAVAELAPPIGMRDACGALAVNRGVRVPRSLAASCHGPTLRTASSTTASLGALGHRAADPARWCSTASASPTSRRPTVFATLLDEGPLLRLDPHDVSTPGRCRPERGAAQSAHPSDLRQARTAGDPTQRSVELGHNEVERSREMDLLHLHAEPAIMPSGGVFSPAATLMAYLPLGIVS